MDMILRIAVLCIVSALLILIVKRSAPESAVLITVGATVIIFGGLAKELEEIVKFLETLAKQSGVGQTLFLPLYKTTAISVVVSLSGGLCRDAGESALAVIIETAGAICAIGVAIPLLQTVLSIFTELIT